MEQEWKYQIARKQKEKNKKDILTRFNTKYKKKYEELELQVHNLARQGSDYGKQIHEK